MAQTTRAQKQRGFGSSGSYLLLETGCVSLDASLHSRPLALRLLLLCSSRSCLPLSSLLQSLWCFQLPHLLKHLQEHKEVRERERQSRPLLSGAALPPFAAAHSTDPGSCSGGQETCRAARQLLPLRFLRTSSQPCFRCRLEVFRHSYLVFWSSFHWIEIWYLQTEGTSSFLTLLSSTAIYRAQQLHQCMESKREQAVGGPTFLFQSCHQT